MEERKEKRIRPEVPYEDPPRSDKRRKTTRKKKEENNVLVSRGPSSSVRRRGKRGRGRGRKSDGGGDDSKLFNERDMFSSDKDDECDGTRKYTGLTCHQCKIMMSSKSDIVFCSKCIKKRYCYDCIGRWYPERTIEEVQAACPFCMGNCNCRACLREPLAVKKQQSEKEENVKLKQLQYLLVKVLPVLRDIYTEQKRELEIETAIRGVPVTESDVIKCEVDPSLRIYWHYETNGSVVVCLPRDPISSGDVHITRQDGVVVCLPRDPISYGDVHITRQDGSVLRACAFLSYFYKREMRKAGTHAMWRL